MQGMTGVWRGLSAWGRVVVVGMFGLVATNIVQFSFLEERAWIYFSALHHRDSGDVLAAAWEEDSNSSSRLSLFFALSFLAPGSTLVIAEEGSTGGGNIMPGRSQFGDVGDYFIQRAYAFGGVTDVATIEGNALDIIEGLDIMQFAVASGSGGFRGPPWGIAIQGGDALVDFPRGYLGRAFRGDDVMTIEPLEFLVVRYPDPNVGGEWEFRWLLVDTRLLPEGTIE